MAPGGTHSGDRFGGNSVIRRHASGGLGCTLLPFRAMDRQSARFASASHIRACGTEPYFLPKYLVCGDMVIAPWTSMRSQAASGMMKAFRLIQGVTRASPDACVENNAQEYLRLSCRVVPSRLRLSDTCPRHVQSLRRKASCWKTSFPVW